ncbi:hypothetical protein MNBD_ALPHA09-545 [hydrothermal vent metagenome]|uniref:Cell shape-determining protein MreC n=1 Tax=hydrothermal vent metagenome TaxID=652676 RepID=A0A3B0TML8_9ZZZZ
MGSGGGRSIYVALFLAAVVLFGLDQANHRLAANVRGLVTDMSLPVLEATSGAISTVRSLLRTTRDYSDLASEYEVLRAENRKLKAMRSEAYVVQARARAYEVLLDYVPQDGFRTIAARTIADVRSPYSRSVIVNAGHERGVSNGSAVLGEAGLVGRVVSAGQKTSRVLLVTDINSRIPVFVGADRYRALLTGTNGPNLSLMYLPASAMLNGGDLVVTSGEGRLLPEGLAIGRVAINANGQPDVVVGRPPLEASVVRILNTALAVDIDPKTTPLPAALMEVPKPDTVAAAATTAAGAEIVRTAVAEKAVAKLPPARE